MSDSKKNKNDLNRLNLSPLVTQDLSGKGWKSEDFNPNSFGDGAFDFSPEATTVNAPGTDFNTPEDKAFIASILKDPREAAAAEGPTYAAGNKYSAADIAKGLNQRGSLGMTPASQAATAEGQKQVGSFLSRVFDYTDDAENPGEYIFDRMVQGMFWAADKVSDVAVTGVRAAPLSGTSEITNDTISPGQIGITTSGKASNTIAEFLGGGETLAQMIVPVYSTLFNPLGLMADASAVYSQPEFDINDPEEQRQAFEEDFAGRLASGTTDAAFTLVGDPTMYLGPIAKTARLRYLDNAFTGANGLALLKKDLTSSLVLPIEQKKPVGYFVAKTLEIDPVTGQKAMSVGAIATRLRGATNAEVIAGALHASKDEELSQLIVRYMYADVEAGQELLKKAPQIFLPLARRQREELMDIINRSPAKKAKLQKNATDAEAKLTDAMSKATPGTARYALLESKREAARDTYNAITNGKLADLEDMSNPIMKGLLTKEFQETVKNDSIIANALTDARMEVVAGQSSFAGATRGFARDNAFGRAVEKSRLRRSNAAYEAAAVRGQMRGTGKMIDLGDGKFVEEMRKNWIPLQFNAQGFQRAINIWRWVGESNPSGFVFTKGPAAFGSWKEVQAVFNDVDIYSGDARSVRWTESVTNAKGVKKDVERTALVGGRQRKEQLLNAYMTAIKSTAGGADAVQIALNKIEQEMIKDIGQWHGMTADAVKDLRRQMTGKRDEVITSLRTSQTDSTPAFWVEDGKTHTSAWLDTHIQNGTYMLNYRELNKMLDQMAQEGTLARLNDVRAVGAKKAESAYNAFNSVWRPSVLLRLGYPQRNVMEGLFRAVALTFSLDPVRQAAVTGGYSVGNAWRAAGYRRAADSAEAAMRLRAAGDPSAMMPRHYAKWLEKEINAREQNIVFIEKFIEQPGRIIADVNKETQQLMLDYWIGKEARYTDRLARAKAAGAGNDEIRDIENLIAATRQEADDVRSISTYLLKDYDAEIAKINRKRSWTLAQKREAIAKIDDANSDILSLSNQVIDDIRSSSIRLADSLRRREMLNNDISSVADYLKSGGAKLRLHNGVIEAPDGTVLNAAFNNEYAYADTALRNSSADASTRAISSTAANTLSNAIRVHQVRNYAVVNPEQAEYMDGVARALRQIKASALGERVIQGQSVKEISDFLYKNPEGRSILKLILSEENGQIAQTAKGLERSYVAMSADEARRVAEETINRYHLLTPSADLREYMKTAVPDDGFTGKVVNVFLGEKDASGKYVLDLKPVIGATDKQLGVKELVKKGSGLQVINRLTDNGMKWLGTYPEDAFVRHPFYGQRYEDVLRETIDTLQSQLGANAKISWKQYESMMRGAHARALKDTKQWLFTIERRTNLGTYGEVAVPFISAYQNSVTTVGRLIWNDPTILAVMTKIWQAPSEMGIIDDEGVIRIPMPRDFLSDELENFLGIENQEWKWNLNQFNLIGQTLEQGLIFQFGPIVSIPFGLMMQNNILGMGPDTPSIMKSIPNGDDIWSTIKNMAFGIDGVPPTDAWEAATDLLPAYAKRLVSALFQSNAEWSKIYIGNYYMEFLKKRGGLRDDYPTKDEINTMTFHQLILRSVSNASLPFPPGWESKLQPIVDDYTHMLENEITAGDADMRFAQKYGSDLLMAKDLGLTEGPVNAVAGMVDIAKRHGGLIDRLAGELQDSGDLTVLSMLFTTSSSSIFDGSVYAWQMGNEVPGLTRAWRERLTGNEAFVNDQKNAGWGKWSMKLSQLDARLASMGLTSYEQSPNLQLEKQTFLANMKNDPMYSAWYRDYIEFGTSRTTSTITAMKAALADPGWIEETKDSNIWQAAKQYLSGREEVLRVLDASGGDITSMKNLEIKRWWDQYRSNLKNIDGWDAFANRFLDGDDNPQDPGVDSLVTVTGG